MAEPIVIQLQELASDSSHDVSDLLHKALLVAYKLDLLDFRDWVANELNGYKNIDSLPEYRIIRGDLRAQNPFHGFIPFIIPNTEIMNIICTIHVTDSLSSVAHLMSDSTSGVICFFFSPEQEASLMQMQDDFAQLRPLRVVGRNQLAAIIQSVRTRVLDWALSLERAGILGDGLTFTKKERNIAMTSHKIQIENFQGVLGDVHGGQVAQSNSLTVTSGNFDSLSRYLLEQSVRNEDVQDLEKAITQDRKPTDPKKLGPHVSSWIGGMISRAANGSWEVSVSTAGTLLAAAIQKYYGL
jgi:hypothetical protein